MARGGHGLQTAKAPFSLSFKLFHKHGCKMEEKHGTKLEGEEAFEEDGC